MKTYLTILLSILFTFPAKAHPALREQIQHIIGNAEAEIGVAIILNGKDTLTFNNEAHYPLMSVMKYHQALAVAHYLDPGISRSALSRPTRPSAFYPHTNRKTRLAPRYVQSSA